MKSLLVRMSVAAVAVLVIVGFAACLNPSAGNGGAARSGSLSIKSNDAGNSHSPMPAKGLKFGAGRIVCEAPLVNDSSLPDHHWIGTLKGCALKGAKIEFWEKPNNYVVGKTKHFFENMLITFKHGDTIKGDDAGVWSLVTFKYQANGRVTGATGRWKRLVGYKFHEIGYTSVVPPPAGSTVVTGTGTVWFAP